VPHYAYVLPAISETLEVAWRHPLSGCLYYIALLMRKSITYEYAREITENIVGFFNILLEWETKGRSNLSS